MRKKRKIELDNCSDPLAEVGSLYSDIPVEIAPPEIHPINSYIMKKYGVEGNLLDSPDKVVIIMKPRFLLTVIDRS
jgi:hypothetical protein